MSRESEHYARVHAIVLGARALDSGELETYLDGECGADEGVRAEVLELLASGRDPRTDAPFADGQLGGARAALDGVLAAASSDWLPERIGDYRVVRQIGSGGMGVVYEAEQISPRRRVALKLLHPAQVTTERLRRFQQEVALLGQLQHPGIARIYEASTFDAGRGLQPFFAMELVDGVDLRTYCERGRLDGSARLELLAKVADIVQYAHELGIVHRDLKPDNVLVDASGAPRVLDFGIASASTTSTALSTALTKEGQLVGTLAYMAPEQLTGERRAITPRVDVFALGVLGFELLLDRLPREVGERPLPQWIARLAREEPLRAGTLDPRLRGDVDTMLGKALESDPVRRYESAAAFAADLRRHLRNQPIRAHPPSTAYVVGKFVRRHRAWVVGATATLFVGAVAAGFWREASSRGDELQTKDSELAAKDSDLLGLSAAADYAGLVQRAATLWPPHPQRIAALSEWVQEARALQAELPSLVAKRDELRGLALPRTADEREAQRRGHPDFAELERITAELDMRLGALAQRRDGLAAALPDVDWELQPDDVAGLHALARPLVHPGRESYGDEALGLVLAERALELAPAAERWNIAMTIALANFELGRDDDAIEVVQAVAEEVEGEARAGRERAIAALLRGVEEVNSEHGIATQIAHIEELEARVDELEVRVDERRSWQRFPAEVEAERRPLWWLEQLDRVIDDLESLEEPDGLLAADGASAEHGWSVPRRLAFAERLAATFAPGGEGAERWAAELPRLCTAYPGLELEPQMGLVPLGPDPVTGLDEFWHVQSGAEPVRGADGALELEADSGLVFVLLPRTTYRMGAQVNPKNWNDDPLAQEDEGAVHEVQLSAFFLSKYELTQAQWRRVAASDPARWTAETVPTAHIDDRHPVERTSWNESVEMLARLDLTLPSEAQWEYAARAGTDTAWPWAAEGLAQHANLADLSYERMFDDARPCEAWDDGFAVHAPVGHLAPNALGFHDMVGNVSEWCLDDYDPGFYRRSTPVDPVCTNGTSGDAVHRGGACTSTAAGARASAREHAPRSSREVGVGMRPARAVTH